MIQEQFNDLLEKWLTQQISEKEFADFREALNDPEHAQWLAGALDNDLMTGKFEGLTNGRQRKAAYELLMKQAEMDEGRIKPAHRVHFLRTAWFKSAATVIILITAIAIYFSIHTPQPQKEVVQATPSPIPGKDIMPGSDKAILTLSNGQQVELNNATSETIKDGTLSIKNINGQLSYTTGGSISPAGGGGAGGAGGGLRSAQTETYNIMSTPRGGQYKLTLSDGTNVWLNAASSITYPIVFTGKTRKVSITGEAYFEVKPNKEKPFIVKTRSDEITVLGTSFNVNAYDDEPAVKTSLLGGIVKVGDTNIKPGQAYQDGKVRATDATQDAAWKNGYFNFNDQNLVQVMRQLSRWYDIEVVYENGAPEMEFVGKMSRNLKLSKVLEFLKGSGVKFRTEGKRLIIMQ